jgi:hypothetical protein
MIIESFPSKSEHMWSGEGKSNLRGALDKVLRGKARRRNAEAGGPGVAEAEKETLSVHGEERRVSAAFLSTRF